MLNSSFSAGLGILNLKYIVQQSNTDSIIGLYAFGTGSWGFRCLHMSMRLLSITGAAEFGVNGVLVPLDCKGWLFGDCGTEDGALFPEEFEEVGLRSTSAHSSASTKAETVYKPNDAYACARLLADACVKMYESAESRVTGALGSPGGWL